jgi:DNA-binding transcriptional regulator YhcF (GntR family)
VKVWRKILDSDIMVNPNANHLFTHLLLRATHEGCKTCYRYQCIELGPGEVLIGTNEIASKSGLTRQSVRTALEYLKSTNRITIRSTKRFSVVSIIKWDTYQGAEEDINHQDNQQINHQVTINQPSSNHIQELKKVKKDQNPVAVTLYEFYANNVHNEPAKRSDAIKNITKLLNRGHTKEDLAETVEQYANGGPYDKPFHANNFFGQKEYYKGFGKYAK